MMICDLVKIVKIENLAKDIFQILQIVISKSFCGLFDEQILRFFVSLNDDLFKLDFSIDLY